MYMYFWKLTYHNKDISENKKRVTKCGIELDKKV